MDNMDLREIQNAITKMILCTDPGFLVHIERTFIFEGKVLMICKNEKTLEWAKHVVEASGGFRGGGWGDASPHQPKSNDFRQKISLCFE